MFSARRAAGSPSTELNCDLYKDRNRRGATVDWAGPMMSTPKPTSYSSNRSATGGRKFLPDGGGAAQSHVCITAIADSDVRFHIQRRCQFTCAVFGDEILDWDSFDGLSSAMVLSPVEVNKKQFVGISNLGKAQIKPTFRKSPSGFSFPLQVLSIG